MVERQVALRGVRDPRVLSAMLEVPREAFIAPELAELAYVDTALPIAAGQTISQPYVVALMLEALRPEPGDRALEVGTGSGYSAALLSRLVAEVFTIERHEELAIAAARRLAELGCDNVQVQHGDGTLGWPEHAPYQVISVTAGGPGPPRALLAQLDIGGRLVMPVGPAHQQELVRITRRSASEYLREDLGAVRFVPLVREQGRPGP